MSMTVGKIVDLVGGTNKAARLAGRVPGAVSNWKKGNRIPAELKKLFEGEIGRMLPDKLFGIVTKADVRRRNGTTVGIASSSPDGGESMTGS